MVLESFFYAPTFALLEIKTYIETEKQLFKPNTNNVMDVKDIDLTEQTANAIVDSYREQAQASFVCNTNRPLAKVMAQELEAELYEVVCISHRLKSHQLTRQAVAKQLLQTDTTTDMVLVQECHTNIKDSHKPPIAEYLVFIKGYFPDPEEEPNNDFDLIRRSWLL